MTSEAPSSARFRWPCARASTAISHARAADPPPARPRARRRRLAAVLVLAQPFDHGQSAIARARAAVDVLPHVGIFHEVTRGADGAVAEEFWQSLANLSEYRHWQAEPTGGPEESAVADGVWMRFDAAVNTVYTQRVIESTGAFTETENVPDLRRQLANPRIRDLGVETLAGQQVRHLELPGAPGTSDGTCEYYADAATLLPVRMACSLGGRPTFVTTYEFVADDAANRANFALTAIHPGAAVKQDPNGIPGSGGGRSGGCHRLRRDRHHRRQDDSASRPTRLPCEPRAGSRQRSAIRGTCATRPTAPRSRRTPTASPRSTIRPAPSARSASTSSTARTPSAPPPPAQRCAIGSSVGTRRSPPASRLAIRRGAAEPGLLRVHERASGSVPGEPAQGRVRAQKCGGRASDTGCECHLDAENARPLRYM